MVSFVLSMKQQQSQMFVEKTFFKVTPGIRLADGGAHDQKRIATPVEARLAGSTHIVVGRAITGATDPRAAYEQINALWKGTE